MSLIPPTALIMSKLKYHIMKKMKDDPSLEEMLAKLGEYPIFKLLAEFRSLENGTINKLEDINKYIQDDIVEWDCIDTSLNMFTRMKQFLKMSITNPGVLRLVIASKTGSGEWSDLYLDEFPINVKGIKDEMGNEMSV